MHRFKWAKNAVVAAIASAGLVFAALLLLASVSEIGFKVSAVAGYGAAVLFVWFAFDAPDRLFGERFARYEPWIVMAAFFLAYLAFLMIAPELGQIKMPYDAMRAQKSLEAGHFAIFRPHKFFHWVNYDCVLSALGMIFSPKLIVGQILNALCRALALYPIFRLSERVAGRRMARFVAIVVGLSPTLTLYATLLVGDYLSALFSLYAMYLFLSVRDWGKVSVPRIYLWVLIGVLAGLSYLFKSISFLFFGAFLACLLIYALESRNLRGTMVSCLALLIIALSHGTVKYARAAAYSGLQSGSKAQVEAGEDFVSGVLYEMYLGMYIPSRGGYVPARDKAFRSAPLEKKKEMVWDMFAKDAKNYPKFVVDKFRMIWGTNDDSIGSILFWFRMSCQNDCYNPRDKNHCVGWLKPLLRAEHLFFSFAFLLGAVGLFRSVGKSVDFVKTGVASLVIVLLFAAMSVLMESQGRYRTAIYPYFFLLIPYARVLFWKILPCAGIETECLGSRDPVNAPRNCGDVAGTVRQEETLSCPSGVNPQNIGEPRLPEANTSGFTPALVWTLVGLLLFFVVAASVVRVVDLGQDYTTHIAIASKISMGALLHPIEFLKENCYPVWHFLTWLLMCVGCGGRSAAAVVTGWCVVGAWAFAVFYWSRRCGSAGRDVALAASLCLMLVSPVWLPFFNPNIVIGQGSPNLLHNPTHLMVRLFAFPCFILYASAMGRIGKPDSPRMAWSDLIAPSAFMLLATLSKPSFGQMFFPAILLYSLVKLAKNGRIALKPLAGVALSLAPALLLTCLQLWVSFYSPHSDGSGIAIEFLKVMSHCSPSVAVSLTLGILFPLGVLVWSVRVRKTTSADVLAWISYVVAVAQALLLVETGRKMWHGNFTWSMNLALFLVWFTSIDRFLLLVGERGDPRSKWWFRVTVAALCLHLLSGVCYLWRISTMGIWG